MNARRSFLPCDPPPLRLNSNCWNRRSSSLGALLDQKEPRNGRRPGSLCDRRASRALCCLDSPAAAAGSGNKRVLCLERCRMLGRYTQQVEADVVASPQRVTAGSVGGLSSRMMVARNMSDASWRRGGTTQQFVDGVLPLPTQPPCAPAAPLPSAADVYQQQLAEQHSMVSAGARSPRERRAQPFALDSPARSFAQRAGVLEAADIEGTSTAPRYVRSRVPLEHQAPDRIAPDGSVVFTVSDASHEALKHRVAQQGGYNHPAPREVVGWESAPDAVAQSRPKELHRPIDRSCTVLDEVVTAGSSFVPTYKRSYAGWDNQDLAGARPPGSPGDFATTHGRARRGRMATGQQPEAAASPRHAARDSQYQPSWSPSALVAPPAPPRQSPFVPARYGEPMQERGKKTVNLGSRSNTVWGMMHPETAAEGDRVGALSPNSRLR